MNYVEVDTNKKIFLFSLVLGLVFVVGCAQSGGPAVTEPTPLAPAPEIAEVPKEVPVPEVKEIRVQGGNFWFAPTSITVNKGDRVKIIFENVGGITHNLGIDGYGRTKTISAGSTDTIEFVADKAGTFDMWCAVEGHRAAGMEGSFVVV